MKKRKTIISLTLLLCLAWLGTEAQVAVISSGGDASAASGSMAYSVGQIVYTTNSSVSGSISQGVQQAYEISVITISEEAENIALSVVLYPNPTIDNLYLDVGDWDFNNGEQLSYYLYSMNGALVDNELIYNKETVIFMGSLSTGVYYLRLLKDKKEIKSFKIIKK
jgi:spore coat protein U-like protein